MSIRRFTLLVLLCLLPACSLFSGYAGLTHPEKTHYQAVADQMTVEQKMHYLSLENPAERQAYMAQIGLGDFAGPETKTAAAPVKIQEETLAEEKTAPAASREVEEKVPEMKAASEAPAAAPLAIQSQSAPLQKAPEVKAPVQEIRPQSSAQVQYTKTGDPLTDVLTLLDLYDRGKISKDQFEREKAVALQRLP